MDSLGYIRIGYVRVDLVRLVGLMVSHWRRFYKWELFCSFSKLPNKCSTFCCRFPDKSKQRDLYLEWVRLCRRTVDPNVRYYHVARLHTQKFQARSVRQKLNKLVLFKGQ